MNTEPLLADLSDVLSRIKESILGALPDVLGATGHPSEMLGVERQQPPVEIGSGRVGQDRRHRFSSQAKCENFARGQPPVSCSRRRSPTSSPIVASSVS